MTPFTNNRTDPALPTGVSREEKGPYLFFLTRLFSNQLVEHGPKLFVDFLHLIDVTRNLVHGLDGHWKKRGREMQRLRGGSRRRGDAAGAPALPSRW